VRWEELFADLEREWDALAGAERQAEIAERTRAEFARLVLVDRLRGSEGRHVRLATWRGRELSGELTVVGADFVLLASGRQEWLVPLVAVGSVSGLGAASVSAQEAGPVRARLGLGSVLRRVAADRSPVTVVGPEQRPVCGTVQRVGADFLELAERPVDDSRRPGRRLLLPFAAIVLLTRSEL
jgi:hypothetical protein